MVKVKRVALRHSGLSVIPGAHKVGDSDPKEEIEVAVHLRYHPAGKALPSLEELGKKLPHQRKHLSHREFESTHGADPADVTRVKSFIREHDLEVLEVNLAHRMVTLRGTITAFNSAFGVQLVDYEYEGRRFRAHEGAVHIPEEFEGVVTGVFGLDSRPAARPYFHLHALEEEDASSSAFEGKFYPNQLAWPYQFPADVNGAGQSIAMIELEGGFEPQYLQQYFQQTLKLPMPEITTVSVAGGQNQPYTEDQGSGEKKYSSANTEVYLDIEVAGAIATGARIVVYFAPNTFKDFLLALKQAVHDAEQNHSVISISWGNPEDKWDRSVVNAFNETLQEAAAKGIAVCAASGDLGSKDSVWNLDGLAHVDFPASSPFALACGGTRLTAEDNHIKEEVVWNDSSGASGGGVSDIFACPPYQNSICPQSVNPGAKIGRGVPDIAGNADQETGYITQVNEKIKVVGGTSAVAPLYAALLALVNQKVGTPVGFLNPFLYSMGQSSDVFHDITVGDNITSRTGGYRAQAGWDACTGWGSVNGLNLLSALRGS